MVYVFKFVLVLLGVFIARANFNPESLEKFKEWLGECDFPINQVEPEFINNKFQLGLVATEDIKSDESFIIMSNECIITPDLVFGTSIGEAVKMVNTISKLEEQYKLAIYLMNEKSNPKSFFKPYFDILPTDFSHLPIYNSDYRRELRGLYLKEDLDQEAINIQSLYRYFRINLFEVNFINQRYPEEFNEEIFNLKNFDWAMNIINSRISGINGTEIKKENIYLIPLIDLINSATNPIIKRVQRNK